MKSTTNPQFYKLKLLPLVGIPNDDVTAVALYEFTTLVAFDNGLLDVMINLHHKYLILKQ